MKNLILLAGLSLFSLADSGAALVDTNRTTAAPASIGFRPGTVTEPRFRVIGYLGGGASLEAIPFGKLTHVNYAFLIPNGDGTFRSFGNSSHLEETVRRAHVAGVKALISVGGWGWDAQFEALAASPAKRAVFVQGLRAFINDHGLDGTDIDWEYPDPGQSAQNFLALIHELRAGLPPHKLLTAAVAASGKSADGIPTESLALFDFLNLMAYDGPRDNHASMELAQGCLDYWQERGLPPEKRVLGLPFYSRPGEVSYRKLVQADPAAAQSDFTSYNGIKQNYNGIPTIQAKTRLAITKASGVMFWTVENDSTDDSSLVSAICHTVEAFATAPAARGHPENRGQPAP